MDSENNFTAIVYYEENDGSTHELAKKSFEYFDDAVCSFEDLCDDYANDTTYKFLTVVLVDGENLLSSQVLRRFDIGYSEENEDE